MTSSEAIDIAKEIIEEFESWAYDADITAELYKTKNEEALVSHYYDYAAYNRRKAEAIRVVLDCISEKF